MHRKLLIPTLICAATLWTAGAAEALSRRGLASTTLKDGTLCFAIVDDSWLFKKTFIVRAMTVSDPAVRLSRPAVTDSDEVWSFQIDSKDQPLKVSADHCLAYGQLPAQATQAVEAPVLTSNKRYSISINAEPDGSHISSYGYGGEFCVVKDQQGSVTVLSSVRSPEERAELERKCPSP